MVIAKQAVASITMGDPTTDIYMRSLVSRHKVTIQQEHLYLRIVMPARPDAASPCRQLALKGRRMRRSGFRVHVGLLPKTLILNRRYLTWDVFSFGFITNGRLSLGVIRRKRSICRLRPVVISARRHFRRSSERWRRPLSMSAAAAGP